jgi:hypothetical protein
LLRERDPDGVIAERLSAAAPAGDVTSLPPVAPLAEPPPVEDPQFALSENAVDIDDIFGEVDLGEIASAPELGPNRSDTADVDLSIALNDMAPIKAPDLDGVFEQLRDEVSKRSAVQGADADYQRALALHRSGDDDGCIPLLRTAAHVPAVRFAAASLLARIFKQRGTMGDAIEWFEHAAEATAPTPTAAHEVLYELADTLESAGEPARALAVWLELQSDAGDHRDVAARIDRLANVKARG